MVAFADALPEIRAKVRDHMALRGLTREKVLATIVHLLRPRLLGRKRRRAKQTMLSHDSENRHVAVDGNQVRFASPAKAESNGPYA
jgi:DNA topoisomerase-1